MSFFLSFFLSFSVQNSFFHFYLLLARYEKRIKNRQNKIVIFSKNNNTTLTKRQKRKNFDAL